VTENPGDLSVIWAELKGLRELIMELRKADERTHMIKDTELQRRLDDLNHWRAQYREEAHKYMPRETSELARDVINRRIDDLARLVYIGVGIVLVVQLGVLVFWRK
jgi:hypothetical protein